MNDSVSYDVSSSESPLVHPTEQKIRQFATLEEGWHFMGGSSFDQSVLQRAIDVHRIALALGFYRTNAFPGLDGEVMVTLYAGVHYLELLIESRHRTITFCHEEGDTEICYKEGLSSEEAERQLSEVRNLLCDSYESSVENTILTTSWVDSTDWRSTIQEVIEEVSLSSAKNARQDPDIPYVSTFDDSIEASLEKFLFSGSSPEIFYRTIAA